MSGAMGGRGPGQRGVGKAVSPSAPHFSLSASWQTHLSISPRLSTGSRDEREGGRFCAGTSGKLATSH